MNSALEIASEIIIGLLSYLDNIYLVVSLSQSKVTKISVHVLKYASTFAVMLPN